MVSNKSCVFSPLVGANDPNWLFFLQMGWEHQLEKGRGVNQFRPGVCCECPRWPVVKINGTSTINGFESFNTSYDRICAQKHWGVPRIFVEPIPDSTHHHTYPWRFDSFSEVRMRKHIDGCLKWSVGYITILMKLGGMQSNAERCWVGPCRFAMWAVELKLPGLVGLYVYGMTLFLPVIENHKKGIVLRINH